MCNNNVCAMCVQCVCNVCAMCVQCVSEVCSNVCPMCVQCVSNVCAMCVRCVFKCVSNVCAMCVQCVSNVCPIRVQPPALPAAPRSLRHPPPSTVCNTASIQASAGPQDRGGRPMGRGLGMSSSASTCSVCRVCREKGSSPAGQGKRVGWHEVRHVHMQRVPGVQGEWVQPCGAGAPWDTCTSVCVGAFICTSAFMCVQMCIRACACKSKCLHTCLSVHVSVQQML